MPVPSPRGDGEKVPRQRRMRGAFVLLLQPPMKRRLRTAAAANAPHLPRPLIRCCRTTFSPLARGEGTAGAVARMHGSILMKAHARPFSPWRRGEGAAAAADEGRFHSSPAGPMKRRLRAVAAANAPDLPRPLIRCCRTTFSPLARGEGTAGAVARMQGCILVKTHAGPFSPLRRGEGKAGAVARLQAALQ